MAIIRDQRRCGNTIRQVDEWIQTLYDKGEVLVTTQQFKQNKKERQNDTFN